MHLDVMPVNSILAWKKVVSPFTGSRENCKKTVFALVSQTDEKKLYVKISLKNIENDSDNFESVTNEFEYCYIIKCWKLLLSSVFADAPNYHKRKS